MHVCVNIVLYSNLGRAKKPFVFANTPLQAHMRLRNRATRQLLVNTLPFSQILVNDILVVSGRTIIILCCTGY